MAKICFFLFLSCLLLQLFLAKSHQPLAPALYVFGDSLVDSGNNNFLPTRIKTNYLPYGKDFVGGPSGRFTNGMTGADVVAELLGLPFVPPYLGLSEAQRATTKTGVNYASGGCGILPETASKEGCLSLGKQINFFEKTVETDLPKQFKSSWELLAYLSNSIFMVVSGSNDYFNYYLAPESGMMQRYSPRTFAELLIFELSKQLKNLYRLGARKIIVYEIGPIGCIPKIVNSTNGQCSEKLNRMVSIYNAKVPKLLLELQFTLPWATFIYAPTYLLARDLIQKPAKYGLTDTTTACCHTPHIILCTPNSKPCKNVKDHVFWDGYHPTSVSNSIKVKHCYNSSTGACTSILKLVLKKFVN